MMASIDQTIVATALPTLQRDLHTQVNWSSWTLTIYALGQILVMPLAGKVGERFGRKRIFLGAVVLFTAASLCCGLAGNFGMEQGHYDVSAAVAELALLPALRDAAPGTVFLADGFSCRTQAGQLGGVQGRHLAQILASPPRP